MAEIRARDDLVLTVNRLMICAMEDIDSGRNEASPTTLDLVQRIEDCDAALRLALETATRERDDIAAWAESWMKRVAAAERERDDFVEKLKAAHKREDGYRIERDALLSKAAPPAPRRREGGGEDAGAVL